MEEWAGLSREARWKAHQREQARIDCFLNSHTYCAADLAVVLSRHKLLDGVMFKTLEGFDLYFQKSKQVLDKLQTDHFGIPFALFLHFELHITLKKILQVTQAACKFYNRERDAYEAAGLLYHPFRKGVYLPVPRLAPPASRITPIIRRLEGTLGVEVADNGKVAFRPVTAILQEQVARDTGTHGMPELSAYIGGVHKGALRMPFLVQWDATGFGALQLTTVAARNPYLPQSSQQLRLAGIGNCGDGRDGTVALMGPNLQTLNEWIREDRCVPVEVDGDMVDVTPQVWISTDVSCLRHTEHLANSGWCCFPRDFALRTIPKEPTKANLRPFLRNCVSPTGVQRFVFSHSRVPGETELRPCTAIGCTFAHNKETAEEELSRLLAAEAALAADTTKAGKARFSKWRMAHAFTHFNVQPGEYGRPLLEYDMDDFILDLLHLAELGVLKTPWKHGILNNASDDARELISDTLAEWKHTLDCKRKDDNRSRAGKWFTGEAWASFCAGQRGSPGGPRAIAELVLIIADDMQLRGVTRGSNTAEEQAAEAAAEAAAALGIEVPKPKPVKASGKAAAAGRNASAREVAPVGSFTGTVPPIMASLGQLKHVPTAIELAADPADLAVIRDLYGSRAQTIINSLLAFDAYFNWYYPLKDMSLEVFDSDADTVLDVAFENCCTAIEMQEICERLSIRNHKSFLFHGAVYKVSRDILRVGNTWMFGTSSLELQNADTKRTAKLSGSKRLEMSSSSKTRVALRPGFEGPARLVETKGYCTTMALSTLHFLLVRGILRTGDGLVATPMSRRKERLFGSKGNGRLSLASAGMKLEMLGVDYAPREDTCIKAFVRLLAHRVAE